MKHLFFVLLFSMPVLLAAQDRICINEAIEHKIMSSHLQEERTYWVSLPLRYSDSLSYPVIYVLDAEWRFDLLRNIIFELGAWEKMEQSIVVGIPHIDWKNQRGIDLTFSHSRVEYDGEAVD
ncbi:MAG: alpha/beta hydrolase-fold protein, partial [Bacteroidota bacterium]